MTCVVSVNQLSMWWTAVNKSAAHPSRDRLRCVVGRNGSRPRFLEIQHSSTLNKVSLLRRHSKPSSFFTENTEEQVLTPHPFFHKGLRETGVFRRVLFFLLFWNCCSPYLLQMSSPISLFQFLQCFDFGRHCFCVVSFFFVCTCGLFARFGTFFHKCIRLQSESHCCRFGVYIRQQFFRGEHWVLISTLWLWF